MRFELKKRSSSSQGLSLVELLVYLAILGMLSVGVATSIRYFQTKSLQVNQESQLELASQALNALLRTKLTGGNTVQLASGYTSPVNGNYCYQISENKPVSFATAAVSNGALFQYRVSASTSPVQNAEPKLASTSTLGLSSSASAADVKRSLSMWVKLVDVDGNNRVLFDYSAEPAATSYKMVVSVVGGNTVHVGMGGTTDYVYNVSNIRNGEWHHLVVLADNLSTAGSSPSLYVDGVAIGVNANTGSPVSSFLNNLNYKINIGDAATAPWSLGPVGFWNRLLTPAEIGKLGRMDGVNIDNAFWLSTPQASLSTSSANVTDGSTINARTQQGYLLFKKDQVDSGQTYYKIYHIDQAASCPDPAAGDNPVDQGFTQLSDKTCANATGTSPLLVGAGAAGQELGFQWRCNLTMGKQQAQASVVTGNTTASVQKSESACGLPIAASDFATTESANTAFVIVDNFDPTVDLLAFQGTDFPAQMTATTTTTGESVSGVPTGTTVTWFADAGNNVGMMKVITSPLTSQTKNWWVDNVFKKIKYKSRSNVYAAERKIVFALGDAWPIKACPGFGYKSSYHFYRLFDNTTALTTLQAYRDAYQNRRYFGMTGYLVNMRCQNEKDQVSLRVLPANTVATIGLWTTTQTSTGSASSPDFSSGRESISSSGSSRTTSNDTWPAGFMDGPDANTLISMRGQTAGDVQHRIIGGPLVDHNVIVLTDNSLCNGATSQGSNAATGGYSWSGCNGMNTLSFNYSCNTATYPNSPACRLQNQTGGNRQYGWWQPAEPNKSGPYIYMGYTGSNYWDDTLVANSQPKYLLEFGDHPWDAVTTPDSDYKTAHINSSTDSSTNLDPPNVASKTMKTVNAQYCK